MGKFSNPLISKPNTNNKVSQKTFNEKQTTTVTIRTDM